MKTKAKLLGQCALLPLNVASAEPEAVAAFYGRQAADIFISKCKLAVKATKLAGYAEQLKGFDDNGQG